MKVGIITCLTYMFAVALTMGGPIRRQTSQSEKTFPIRGNVTLLCPLVTDDTLEWIYWQKNNRTIYSRNVNSQTTTTNDKKYEGITYATRLTIKDLQETDSGIYHCKVSTTVNIEEGGHVMISVTDQEGGLFTTSPGFPVRASTSMPPKPPEDNTFYLAFSITLSILIIIIIIIIITMCLVFKYRTQIAESRLVKACQRPAPTRIALTSVPAAPNPEHVEEGTHTPFLGSDTHGTDDVDVDDRPDDSQAFTTETREPQVPLVGRLIIDDLRRASTGLVNDYMCDVLDTLMKLYGLDARQNDGKYSFLKKYVWCIPKSVLDDSEHLLDELDHIPVGRKRDVCEIMMTMPENQQINLQKLYEIKDIFEEYEQDEQGNTVEHESKSRSELLRTKMRTILSKSLTRDAARIYISLAILDPPVGNSGSASSSQQTDSTLNQSASETQQNTSVLSQRDGDSKREEDNLIDFWLSKVMKLQPNVQRRIRKKLGGFEQEALRPSLETTTDPSITRIPDAKEFKKNNGNESINLEKEMDPIDMQNVDAKTVKISNLKGSTDQEPQPSTSSRRPLTNSQALPMKQVLAKIAESDEPLASRLKDLVEKLEKEEKDKHEEKAIGCIDMQNYDAKEVKNANLKKSTELNKKSIEIHGEKEKG